MARIAYNLSEKKDRESWFLILVDYHPEYFYLTFAEMTACTDRDSHQYTLLADGTCSKTWARLPVSEAQPMISTAETSKTRSESFS